MVSKFALLSNLLLATAALAVHSSSPVEAPLARSRETRQSSTSTIRYNNANAGASWGQVDKTFTTVTADITVPNIWGDDGVVMAWVGIDSDSVSTCISGTFFRAGLNFSISGGKVSYSAFWEWYPESYYVFPNFAMNVDDTITVNIFTDTPNFGQVFIQNQQTGQTAWFNFTSSKAHPLCGATAAWIGSKDIKSPDISLANFDVLFLSSASASGSNGVLFKPEGSTNVLEMENMQNHTTITSVFAIGSNLLITLLALLET